MNFWLHQPRLNRYAHSRFIQIVEVKHNMQKTFDSLLKSTGGKRVIKPLDRTYGCLVQ